MGGYLNGPTNDTLADAGGVPVLEGLLHVGVEAFEALGDVDGLGGESRNKGQYDPTTFMETA
jgi:hypothetical protein